MVSRLVKRGLIPRLNPFQMKWALFGLMVLLLLFTACTLPPRKIELQGISGAFRTHRLPTPENCTDMFTTQEDLDFCKLRNAQHITEPLQGTLSIRSLESFERQTIQLDSNGGYRLELKPGYYSVCLGKSCSDAIEVRMNAFATYSAEFPLEKMESVYSGNPEGQDSTRFMLVDSTHQSQLNP